MGNTEFTLSGGKELDVTALSNSFIDHIMPKLNGAYVKVYIYLLRSFSCRSGLSVTTIADALDSTDSDILRALSSLEKYNLIRLVKNEAGEITEIRFADSVKAAEPQSPSVPSFMIKQESQAPLAPVTQFPGTEARREPETAHIPEISDAKLKALKENVEVEWLMSKVENYLGRLLNPSDTQLIVYLHCEVGFDADLIFYLYEYCTSKGKNSSQYIEKVALNWVDKHITTVEEAQNESVRYNEHYITVSKAFGMGRMPASTEQEFINRWTQEFNLSDELITEACNRTLLATGKPDFKYANKIMENWAKKDVRTLSDVAALDSIHQQASARSAANFSKSDNRTSGNKSNAFMSRNYTTDDIDNMEKVLLNREG
ncbi:MAG: DnaD domain protein [Lachnospiraceae bacterium]|nr:DnaD domain protein [Lachnospiraceae bacterium]